MQIVYIAHINFAPGCGVMKKILAQVEKWRELGHEADLLVLTRRTDLANALGELGTAFLYSPQRWRDRLRALHSLEEWVNQVSPQVIYLRQDMYYPTWRRLALKYPLVVEVNSDVSAELKPYSKGQWLYERVTRWVFWRAVSGAVFVTHELQKNACRTCGRKVTVVIANGIDLRDFPILPAPSHTAPPALAFMGQPGQTWHGLDKIKMLACHWPEASFHIIGPSAKDIGPITENVQVHGYLDRKNYENILSGCQAALSTLALHRNAMNEACSLKSREYLAYGLPIIGAYKDPDIPGSSEYYLRLPNREDNIVPEMEKIKLFVNAWKNRRVGREQCGAIDLTCKEEQRLGLFKKVSEAFCRPIPRNS